VLEQPHQSSRHYCCRIASLLSRLQEHQSAVTQ
jgi:hypothetical protein